MAVFVRPQPQRNPSNRLARHRVNPSGFIAPLSTPDYSRACAVCKGLVYHVSNGPNGGGTYHREVAIDKLSFNADGTIPKVTPSSGLSF
jgi:hypothetical protein